MNLKKIFLFGLIAFVFIGVIVGGSFWFLGKKNKDKTPSQEEVLSKIESVTKEVSKLILLPSETPSLATVMDADVLKKDQPFYQNAQNGDIVLLYIQERRAIIYNPSEKKLVNVGPIVIDPEKTDMATVAEVSSSTLSVEIRNGSGVAGRGGEAGKKLKSVDGFVLGEITDAARTDYVGNMIVDLSGGGKPLLVEKLKILFNAEVVSVLPVGETVPKSGVLLIVGEQ